MQRAWVDEKLKQLLLEMEINIVNWMVASISGI